MKKISQIETGGRFLYGGVEWVMSARFIEKSNAPVGSIWTAIHGLWKTAITRTEQKKDTVKISRRKVRR